MANVWQSTTNQFFVAIAAFVCQINVDYRVIRSNLNTSRKYDEDGANYGIRMLVISKKSLQPHRKISNITNVKKIRDFVKKYFFTGLLVILPVWATYYVLSELLGVIDGILGDLPAYFLGHRFPGLGIITLFLFILLIGILFANYFGRRKSRQGER